MITDLDNRIIWKNGKLMKATEAKIYALAPTAQFGLNVFEGIPVYFDNDSKQSYAFRLEDHYNRLFSSARLLELNHGLSVSKLKKSLIDVVKANGADEDVVVRQILFVEGVGSWGSDGPVGMIASPLPRNKIGKEYQKTGLNCCVSSWQRISGADLSPSIKCGANYINSRMGHREAIRNGYDTCIFLNNKGTVSEGAGSCIFIIKNNKLITPMLTDSVLDSITRKTILTIARDKGYMVEERSIDRTELYTCDEAFLCGSSMEITSINAIDGFEISEHGITDKIKGMYEGVVRGRVKKYREWLSPIE